MSRDDENNVEQQSYHRIIIDSIFSFSKGSLTSLQIVLIMENKNKTDGINKIIPNYNDGKGKIEKLEKLETKFGKLRQNKIPTKAV